MPREWDPQVVKVEGFFAPFKQACSAHLATLAIIKLRHVVVEVAHGVLCFSPEARGYASHTHHRGGSLIDGLILPF